MINIVIVGAGFGGLQTALNLEKNVKYNKNISLTLIDQRDYHLFTPNLYEVASSEEELASVEQMKKSITLPIREVIAGKKIKFIKGRVESLQPDKKQLTVSGKQILFDYLVLALGSESSFYNVEGAQAHALPLKSLPDALRIRNQIGFVIQAHKQDMGKKTLRVVIAGGGYTGLELAGELKGAIDFLAWENGYPREKIEVEIIEAGNKLISGFDDRLSEDAYVRLNELNLRVRLSARITKVDAHFLELDSGEKVSYDVLLWTTGVKACSLNSETPFALDRKGRLQVNEFLQVIEGIPHSVRDGTLGAVFALGDMACILGSNGQPAPDSAQDAWDQAKYLAYALPYIIKNKRPPNPFKNKHHGFIVNLAGKWAIVAGGKIYLKGFLGHLINQAAHLRYYASLVGWIRAVKYIIFQMEMYGRNDG
jgi:NADH dehydrogenase